jgi:hypothetical protein
MPVLRQQSMPAPLHQIVTEAKHTRYAKMTWETWIQVSSLLLLHVLDKCPDYNRAVQLCGEGCRATMIFKRLLEHGTLDG